jgi:hypothetical protein
MEFFLVSSVYNHLFRNWNGNDNKQIWKAKIPLKIKIFMWLTLHNATLTKDNLLISKWKGSPSCVFCQEDESVLNLFFECPVSKYIWSILAYIFGATVRPTSFVQFWVWIKSCLPSGRQVYFEGLAAVCWAIWRTRNSVCSDGKRVKCPTEIICLISSTFIYWAGLQKEDISVQLEHELELYRRLRCFSLAKETGWEWQ